MDLWPWSQNTALKCGRCLTAQFDDHSPLIVSKSSLGDDHQNHSVVQVSQQSKSLHAEAAANCGRYCIGSFQDGDWPNALKEITKCCLSSAKQGSKQSSYEFCKQTKMETQLTLRVVALFPHSLKAVSRAVPYSHGAILKQSTLEITCSVASALFRIYQLPHFQSR